MWIRLKDLSNNKVTLNTDLISAIIIPSPLNPGDGKSRIFCGALAIEISMGEALRVAGEVCQTEELAAVES